MNELSLAEGVLGGVQDADAECVLAAMLAHPLGVDAALIGEVVEDVKAFVQMRTRFGSRRATDWRSGDQLPRSC